MEKKDRMHTLAYMLMRETVCKWLLNSGIISWSGFIYSTRTGSLDSEPSHAIVHYNSQHQHIRCSHDSHDIWDYIGVWWHTELERNISRCSRHTAWHSSFSQLVHRSGQLYEDFYLFFWHSVPVRTWFGSLEMKYELTSSVLVSCQEYAAYSISPLRCCVIVLSLTIMACPFNLDLNLQYIIIWLGCLCNILCDIIRRILGVCTYLQSYIEHFLPCISWLL